MPFWWSARTTTTDSKSALPAKYPHIQRFNRCSIKCYIITYDQYDHYDVVPWWRSVRHISRLLIRALILHWIHQNRPFHFSSCAHNRHYPEPGGNWSVNYLVVIGRTGSWIVPLSRFDQLQRGIWISRSIRRHIWHDQLTTRLRLSPIDSIDRQYK